MGWGQAEFWACTPRYFLLAQKGWTEAEQEREEMSLWRVRWQTFWLLDARVKKAAKLYGPEQMMQLPSDTAAQPKKPDITPEQRAELFRKIDEAILGKTNT